MSGYCCGTTPRVYIDGKWSCAECGSVLGTDIGNTLDFSDVFIDKTIKRSYEKKCECGADKTYGEGNGMHSATMPCPLYKKS